MKTSLIVLIGFLSLLFVACELECDPTVENCDDIITPNCPSNSSFECSSQILLGRSKISRINVSGEADYFALELNEIGVLELEVDAVPAGIYMYVRVYNHESSVLSTGEADSGQSITFDAGPMGAGTHYIAVWAYNNQVSDENYTLNLSLDTNDDSEFNNTFTDAQVIKFDTPVRGTIRSNGDVDYFKFTNNTIGVVEVSIPEVPDGIYMYATVYSTNNENSRIGRWEADSGQSIHFDAGPFEIGDHYILLWAYNNGSSADTYELELNWDASDQYEFNNSFSQATAINVGETKTATIRSSGDIDFYKVTTNQAGVLQVSIPEVPDGVYMYAQIYGTNNQNSSLGRGEADSGQILTFQANASTSAGTHYVKVWAYSTGSSDDPYKITINNN